MALSSGQIRNGYEIKILNKTHREGSFSLSLSGLENPLMEVKGAGDVSLNNLPVAADSVAHYHVFVSTQPQDGERKIEFIITDLENGTEASRDSVFISQ